MKHFLDRYSLPASYLLIAAILALVPFHAFITVWPASMFGHYTALRLWEEVLLVPLLCLGIWQLGRNRQLRVGLQKSWLWRIAAAYLTVQMAWAITALMLHGVGLKAAAYGLLINTRFLLFFFAVWVAASRGGWLHRNWAKLTLAPAVIVMVVGLLQRYVLPHDFLRHFGYNDSTIAPYETIDHKVEYLRIQSTLRGANLLGTYMIIVLALSFTVLRRYWRWLALAVGALVLFLSGSRGAWVGELVALLVMAWLEIPGRRLKQLFCAAVVLIGFLGVGLLFQFRNADFVQNTFFHTDEHSRSSQSSNAAHLSSSYKALKQVVREPLGRGVGTAGPASLYNTEQSSRIAENYFLQIGQETGWVGFGLFIALCVAVANRLWALRQHQLARSLFAAFVGISCVAMLMHIWSDETVAFLWWGLAGIALAAPIAKGKHAGPKH